MPAGNPAGKNAKTKIGNSLCFKQITDSWQMTVIRIQYQNGDFDVNPLVWQRGFISGLGGVFTAQGVHFQSPLLNLISVSQSIDPSSLQYLMVNSRTMRFSALL